MIAARERRVDVVILLLSAGANIEATDKALLAYYFFYFVPIAVLILIHC